MNIECKPIDNPITLESVGRPIPDNHQLFDTPHTILLLGQKRCGKTNFTLNALKNPKLFNKHFVNICVFSPNADQFNMDVVSNQNYVFQSFSDEKLQSCIELAVQNKEEGDNNNDIYETLLIVDDAMGSDLLRSKHFKALMSRHRNINMSIWLAIQDNVELSPRLRGLFDNIVCWKPLNSDLLIIAKGLETTYWPKEDLVKLFKSPSIYNDSHDFLSFNKRKKQIIRNLQEEIIIKQ